MKELIAEIIREEMRRTSKVFYFMAGLPRSGSSLLSAILNQNPKIYSGPNSPVVGLMVAIENMLSNDEHFLAHPKPEQAKEIISNIITHYYSDVKTPIVIDKNRGWTDRAHYISGYFGIEPKIIVPVRDMTEILASFLAMHKRNGFEVNGKVNFIDEILIKMGAPLNDVERCKMLSGPNGIVGQSYDSLKKALIEGRQKQLHFVEYTDLINDPKNTLKKLYEFLNEEPFEHDFSNIKNDLKLNDAQVYGLADMHEVRSELKNRKIDPQEILPEEVYKLCQSAEFWRNLEDFTPTDNEEDVEENSVADSDEASKMIGT
jgi:sulfotransferase